MNTDLQFYGLKEEDECPSLALITVSRFHYKNVKFFIYGSNLD